MIYTFSSNRFIGEYIGHFQKFHSFTICKLSIWLNKSTLLTLFSSPLFFTLINRRCSAFPFPLKPVVERGLRVFSGWGNGCQGNESPLTTLSEDDGNLLTTRLFFFFFFVIYFFGRLISWFLFCFFLSFDCLTSSSFSFLSGCVCDLVYLHSLLRSLLFIFLSLSPSRSFVFVVFSKFPACHVGQMDMHFDGYFLLLPIYLLIAFNLI